MNLILSFTVSLGNGRVKLVYLLDSATKFISISKESVEKHVDECHSPPMVRFVCSYG